MNEYGNIAAMREALEKIRDKCVIYNNDLAEEIDALCGNALSAPPRNCDVGTADEQANRFKAFCYANRTPDNECSKECPFNDTSAVGYCQARWAQMPFAPAEGGPTR